jgi:hypothetical protein
MPPKKHKRRILYAWDNWPPGSDCIAPTSGSSGLSQHQIYALHGPKQSWSHKFPAKDKRMKNGR